MLHVHCVVHHQLFVKFPDIFQAVDILDKWADFPSSKILLEKVIMCTVTI